MGDFFCIPVFCACIWVCAFVYFSGSVCACFLVFLCSHLFVCMFGKVSFSASGSVCVLLCVCMCVCVRVSEGANARERQGM